MPAFGKTITRQDLYAAVWERPLKALAQEWNTTYARIVEACQTMEVPRPGQEYWPWRALGRQVESSPLPELSGGGVATFELLPAGARREKAKAKPAKAVPSPTIQTPPPPAAPAPADFQSTADPIAQAAAAAVLDMLRQAPELDFWRGQVSRKIYHCDLRRQLDLPKNLAASEAAMLAALKKVRKEYRTFKVTITETPDREAGRLDGYQCITLTLADGCEWSDAVKESWSLAANPNPHDLTDNGLRLYLWAKGPKNQGVLTESNRIGAQARLRGTYGRIVTHLQEIQHKADQGLRWATDDNGWRSKVRVWFATEGDKKSHYNYGPLNPALNLNTSPITVAELDRFKAWFYSEVLGPGFPNEREVVAICDLGTRKQVKHFLKPVPEESGRWGPLPAFLKSLRLLPGIELNWRFEDGPGPWLILCQPSKDVTWARLKDTLRAKAQEIPLEKRYALSADSRALLRWIEELGPQEFLLSLTPPVESVMKTEIGIAMGWGEDNLRAYIEVLLEEINERTDFRLRTVDWKHYGSTVTRILVKRKEDDLQTVTRSIQMLGLKQNRLVDGAKVAAAISALIT